MQLALILVVLAFVTCLQHATDQPVQGAMIRLLLTLGAIGGVGLLTALGSLTISAGLQRSVTDRAKWIRLYLHLKRAHLALWLLVTLTILHGLQWPQVVKNNWHLDGWFLLDELLILIPLLLPLLIAWIAFFEVERRLQRERPERTDQGAAAQTRSRYLLLHLRHEGGLLLLPVIALLAAEDLVQPGVATAERQHGWLVYPPAMVLLALAFPCWLRRVWKTSPLPEGPVRQRLNRAARNAGLQIREFLVWHTDGRMINAAVSGLLPRWRYLFLSDGLLGLLSANDVEAIFWHEAGHLRRKHLWLRLLLICQPLLLWMLVHSVLPGAGPRLQSWLLDLGFSTAWQTGILLPAGIVLLAGTTLSWYAKTLEHEADLFACQLGSPQLSPDMTDQFITTLQKLAALGRANPRRGGWLHPSTQRRVAFLRRVQREPAWGQRFEQRTRRYGQLLVSFSIASLVVALLFG